MQTAFDESKQEILRQCEKGVKLFSPELPTALATDWSKFGVGFWLTQKHCKCDGSNPRCCETGWQTVYCGSRFCSFTSPTLHLSNYFCHMQATKIKCEYKQKLSLLTKIILIH